MGLLFVVRSGRRSRADIAEAGLREKPKSEVGFRPPINATGYTKSSERETFTRKSSLTFEDFMQH